MPGTQVGMAPSPAGRDAAPAANEPRILSVRDLPEDVRKSLPNVSVSGSTYSSDKASRMLMINGQIFHEGDAIASGLVLQQIRPRGAVFGFKGYRYEVAF
ncbi:MAG: general secretion pathway protein GspB [Caldimonas sp.]